MSGVVQKTALVSTTGASTISYSLSGVTPANALAISMWGWTNSLDSTFTFPAGAGWTATQKYTPHGYGTAAVAVQLSAAGGATTITVTAPNASAACSGIMYEIAGVTGIDTAAIGTAANSSSTTLTVTGGAALAQANELALSAITYDDFASVTEAYAVGSPWTLDAVQNDATTHGSGAAASNTYSAIGTPSAAWSGLYSDTEGHAAVLVPLKLSSGGTNGTASGHAFADATSGAWGAATGVRNPTAAGHAFAGAPSAVWGSASATRAATAGGHALAATPSSAWGGASATRNPTTVAAALAGAARFFAGSAYANTGAKVRTVRMHMRVGVGL